MLAVIAGVLGLLVFVSLLAAAPAGGPEIPSRPALSEKEQDNRPEVTLPEEAVRVASESPGSEVAAVAKLSGGQSAVVRYDRDTGVPAFVTGEVDVGAGAPSEASYAFLEQNSSLYQMDAPRAELEVASVDVDDLGMAHVRLDQVYMGVPVFAADMLVHLNRDGKVTAVNGKYVPDIEIDVEPALAQAQAETVARAALEGEAPVEVESGELSVLVEEGSEAVLAWKIVLVCDEPPVRQVVFVDAHTGKIASSYDDIQDIKDRKTYTANNGTTLPGTLLITEGGSSGDAVAQAAHDNIGYTYDYFYGYFGRDSYNNAGATLKSTVHYGNSYNNAFWNGSQMTYGDGDGYVFSPLGSSLDVVAHELTHGVTQYSAGLVYSYQSGALNESYSDVFAVMVDRDDWLLGEDAYTPHTPGDALRSIANPARFGQPEHMDSYVHTNSDNGGVHTNSGIPNKAAYNVAMAIGKEKMEQIWYRTLTLYLTSSSQFTDARDASVQAAADLYGAGSAEVGAVVNGFNAVGISGSQLSDTTARIEIDHTYRGDLVVTLGVGDPAAPAWSTVVSNRSGGSADNIYKTVDIAAAAAYLPPDWQNRWFLQVHDAAGFDTGAIVRFEINDHDVTYTATDLPLTIADHETVTSFVPTDDPIPPSVLSVSPQDGETGFYAHHSIAAAFSETLMPATVNDSTFFLTESGGAVVPATLHYNNSDQTVTLTPDSDLKYSTVYDVEVNTGITDAAGNPLQQSYNWSFTTAPEPKIYYFTWYDMNSLGMNDWVVMGNPDSHAYNAGFSVDLNDLQGYNDTIVVAPGDSESAVYPGRMGGPVAVAALEGESQIVSRRTLYGSSLEEIVGVEADALDSHYYFTWYDTLSQGVSDWVLISNPGESALEADIYIGGSRMNTTPYLVAPGATVTPDFKDVMAGPVEVVTYEAGNPSVPRDAIVSQRVLWNGDFTEVMGVPASSLSSSYMYSWYDMQSPGAASWMLVANPHRDRDLAVEIWIAGERMSDEANDLPYFSVPAGTSITPVFPGVMNGPVIVKGYDAATYDPDAPGDPDTSFYTTQRSLFGNTFEEVIGYGLDRLSSDYFFSWYDQVSPGSNNWVLVSNPGDQPLVAEIWIAGSLVSSHTLAPGTAVTPTYPGLMNGPVEVRGYIAATYNPASPGAPNANLFTSQRVLWSGNFNEVTGAVLSN